LQELQSGLFKGNPSLSKGLVMKHLLLLLYFASLVSSCDGRLAPSTTQGTISDGLSYRWPSPLIPVCWENPSEATAAAQTAVEEIVVKEYARAGIHFTGWDSCTAESRGIRIFHADTNVRQVLAFGARLDGVPNGLQLNLEFQETSFYGCTGDSLIRCVEEDALHEFGHALGLRHEQSRTDSFCAQDQSAGIGEAGALPITPYDKDSVMNYCANDLQILLNNERPELSFWDVLALRVYYATDVSLGQRACLRDGHQWRENDLASCCEIQHEQLKPFNSRPYHYCEKDYPMRLETLSDDLLKDFLGADYEVMQSATSENSDGPWLNLELACRYENFRSFGWEFYLDGDQLREFITNKSFPIEMKPASNLICDGISIENPAARGEYLKTSFSWKPSYQETSSIGGTFERSQSPAWVLFQNKAVLVELPTLDFQPQSLVLTCNRNDYIGYYQEDGERGPVMRFDIPYNASYGPATHLHCSRLEAFDSEIPRDATQSYRFKKHFRRVKLDAKDERFLVELNRVF
jgi:hypothetical protein